MSGFKPGTTRQTMALDLDAGGLCGFIERYEALFTSKGRDMETGDWLRQHDLLQGNIANEVARQYREREK